MNRRAVRAKTGRRSHRGAGAAFPAGGALDFLQRLWRLNHALERLSLAMAARIGVTAQQRFVIRCVGRFRGLTAGQLATILHVDPGTISTTLGRLGDKGLVARRRDPLDGRRVTVTLTAAGRALDRPAAGTVEDAARALLVEVTTAEANVAVSTIDALARLLEERAVSLSSGPRRGPRRRAR